MMLPQSIDTRLLIRRRHRQWVHQLGANAHQEMSRKINTLGTLTATLGYVHKQHAQTDRNAFALGEHMIQATVVNCIEAILIAGKTELSKIVPGVTGRWSRIRERVELVATTNRIEVIGKCATNQQGGTQGVSIRICGKLGDVPSQVGARFNH